MKGTVDIIYLIAMLFAVVIMVASAIYITNQLFAGISAQPKFSTCTSCEHALTQGQAAQQIIPNAIVIVFLLMCFGSIILAAFLDSSPIFIVFEVLTVPIELLVAYVFHDAFFQITSSSFLGNVLATSPSVALLFEWLPIIVLVITAIGGVVTFIKPNG